MAKKKKKSGWTRQDPDWEMLYESYTIWCEFNGHTPMSYQAYITENLKILES